MKKAFAFLLSLALLTCALFTLSGCTKQEAAPVEEPAVTEETAVALKDNPEEAEYQIKVAFQKWLEQAYGDDVVDARIYVEKIYGTEEEQATEVLKDYNLTTDEVAFEVRYELRPAEGADINALTAATGVYDEQTGWITEKYNLGILRPAVGNDNGYIVTDIGTGW